MKHQGQRVFDGRQTGGRLRVGLLLLLERMRRMVGRHDLNRPVQAKLAKAAGYRDAF